MSLAEVLLNNLFEATGHTLAPLHYGEDDDTAGTPGHNLKEEGVDEYSPENARLAGELAARHTRSEDVATTMSNNDRTEAMGLLAETRDWFRGEVEVGDETLILWVRIMDRAIDLLTTEVPRSHDSLVAQAIRDKDGQ